MRAPAAPEGDFIASSARYSGVPKSGQVRYAITFATLTSFNLMWPLVEKWGSPMPGLEDLEQLRGGEVLGLESEAADRAEVGEGFTAEQKDTAVSLAMESSVESNNVRMGNGSDNRDCEDLMSFLIQFDEPELAHHLCDTIGIGR
jgi:hypothetical protein